MKKLAPSLNKVNGRLWAANIFLLYPPPCGSELSCVSKRSFIFFFFHGISCSEPNLLAIVPCHHRQLTLDGKKRTSQDAKTPISLCGKKWRRQWFNAPVFNGRGDSMLYLKKHFRRYSAAWAGPPILTFVRIDLGDRVNDGRGQSGKVLEISRKSLSERNEIKTS